MDWGNVAQIASAVVAIAAFAVAASARWSAGWRAKAAQLRAELGRAGEKIETLETLVAKLDGEVRHLPDQDTAHRLEMAVARLEGRLETMDERLKPVSAMATRMQDYLMERGK